MEEAIYNRDPFGTGQQDPSQLEGQLDGQEPFDPMAESGITQELVPVTANDIEVLENDPDRDSLSVSDEPTLEQSGTRGWFKKHGKTIAWAGASAMALASVGITVASDKLDHLKDQAVEALPWALTGLAVSEAVFIAGGILMLGTVGKKVHNFFRIRKEVATFQEQARLGDAPKTSTPLVENRVFRVGFALNAIGALGTAGVVIAAVAKMPHESWGLMSLAGLDIFATLSLRGLVWKGLKMGKKSHSSEENI